jgi:hypothetical protein
MKFRKPSLGQPDLVEKKRLTRVAVRPTNNGGSVFFKIVGLRMRAGAFFNNAKTNLRKNRARRHDLEQGALIT